MDLDNFFKENQSVELQDTEKQLVIREMLNKLETLGLIENSNRYYAQVIHRESLENTGIGHGFAIPHVRTDSVSSLISIFGYSQKGIDYQSYDNIPVRYILLSIFPTEMSTKYLYLTGMMARIFSSNEKIALLDAASSPEEIYSILKKESLSYFEKIDHHKEKDNQISETFTGIPSSSDLDLLIRLDRLYKIYDEGDTTESLVIKIEQIKKLIENRSLTYYEKMRNKCQNPFSIVDRNSCTECHLEIPSIYLNQMKERKSISICTHCGRFLIVL